MKDTNAPPEHLYQDALGDQLAGVNTGSRRIIASPHKTMMMHHLASGQANLGTPLRSRLESHDSQIGVYQSLKCEESMMHPKTDQQF